ncbi:MAG: hypothetical protein KKB31_03480 [Nanoarchaeota archaeon]|nr:hypothetical protein [Nanoarchaeota archaeon]
MKSKFAYCPVCMFRTRIQKGKKASHYICPRHGFRCIYSGEETNLPWQG